MKQSRLDRAHRAIQRGSNPVQGIIHKEPQVDYLTVLVRQSLDALAQQRVTLSLLCGLVGLRSGVGKAIDYVVRAFVFTGIQRGKRNGAFLSPNVPITIQQDGAKPGKETAATVVSTHGFPSLDQSVLCQVLREGILTAERNGLSEKTRFMRATQLAESVGVTGLRSREQAGRDCLIRFQED
ncbi:MAG TPA: hypothetical protein VK846_10820 [Candidatus Limnocylindria bacterium]|nr:hypothetical protein [Candidatus Limnocylindria bacterium]